MGLAGAGRPVAAMFDRGAGDLHVWLYLPGGGLVPQDAQALASTSGIVLPEVGVEGLYYPLLVADGQGGKHEVVATVTMSVRLDAETKGAHLSRFIEVLHGWREPLGPETAIGMVDDLRQRMGSTSAQAQLSFMYFLERESPVTGTALSMGYDCVLTVTVTDDRVDVTQRVRVPVTSVCPCSEAISDRGAHNQRGWVTIEARPSEPTAEVWFDDLIAIAESVGSPPGSALVKQPDECPVTTAGYDNAVFVEDMTRTVAQALSADPRIAGFAVRVVNGKSIHSHTAYAHIPWTAGVEASGAEHPSV